MAEIDEEGRGQEDSRRVRSFEDEVSIVPDITVLMDDDEITYTEAIKKLHKSLVYGDIGSYHDANINLPRHLRGLRTATTIAKITDLN